ncbi:MAG: nucleoside phosphorylase [Chitinophagales bacterium]|nr:nucleoside phosphorylase [Chitinophagales bacterium]
MPNILSSELVVNPDGSIYHLKLRPEEVAPIIITVGDPGRVAMVSKYFDEIEVKKDKREFHTHTGRLGSKRITVISTGIGPDNIDIVFNELDALFNIDLEARTIKEELTQLNFIRIGTSGSLQADIPVDSFLASAYGLGLDNLIHYYQYQVNLGEAELTDELNEFLSFTSDLRFYPAEGSPYLLNSIADEMAQGITLTAPGFYAPQGRSLRLPARFDRNVFEQLGHFSFQKYRITNLEMETSAIYGLSRMLGHRALSTNVILANRPNGQFSTTPHESVDRLIRHVLEKIENSDL